MVRIFGKKLSGKTIFNIATIMLSLGLLVYFCLSEDGLINLAGHIHDFKILWLIAGFLCMILDLVFDAVLIYIFTKNIQEDYTARRAFKVCMVGHLYSAVTPFQSGGQPMQIYVMNKQGVDPGLATSAMVQKFFIYQTGITLYSLFAIIFQLRYFRNTLNPLMWWLAAVGFVAQIAVAMLLLVFSFNPRVTHKVLTLAGKLLSKLHLIKDYETTLSAWEKQLESFHVSNQYLYKNRLLVLKTYGLTFLQLTSLFAVSYCIFRAFNIGSVSPVNMICSQAFVTMVSSLIPLPGAAGASEGSFAVFFSSFFTSGTLKSAILVWRIITYYSVILISAPFSRIAKKM
ncbi:MAG TPA: lysylphosphatidylglycerol synthase transmembrane domain-containing protein [Caproiciproducens sp.]|nr:lysylphosphatidylglycerol synthase transmembrane domain-containing protein [Caproiciproducens sp.]